MKVSTLKGSEPFAVFMVERSKRPRFSGCYDFMWPVVPVNVTTHDHSTSLIKDDKTFND
jgi:hypothetical protein